MAPGCIAGLPAPTPADSDTRPAVSTWRWVLLLRLAAGELQPLAGHVGGQVAKSGHGRIVAGGVALVGGLAPGAQPGLAASLQRADAVEPRHGLRPAPGRNSRIRSASHTALECGYPRSGPSASGFCAALSTATRSATGIRRSSASARGCNETVHRIYTIIAKLLYLPKVTCPNGG
jgi:hypothetical protein